MSSPASAVCSSSRTSSTELRHRVGKNYGFGIYDGGPTTWTDADGYLPAQITSFSRDDARVSVTEFCDKVVLGGDAFVVVYRRVAVTNPTDHVVEANPEASPGLVANSAPDAVAPHTSVDHDYVIASDRFGGSYPWPSAAALAGAGAFDQHFAHMASYWNDQLSAITGISVPDRHLDDAYRSGFIYTQIARSGDELPDGVNGYEAEYNHDVIGILSNLFNQGYFIDSHALLLEARNAMEAPGQGFYDDGVWTYSVPWAIYLMKTGDLAFVKENFDSEGPLGAAQPSIEDTAHAIAAGRTSPTGNMAATDDIDTQGFWTTDDYSALSAWPPTTTLPSAWAMPARRSGRPSSTTACCRLPTGRWARPSPATTSTTYPVRFSGPTRPTGARIPRTPTGCPRSAPGPGRVALRGGSQGPGRHHDRRHVRLRLRPSQGQAPTQHLRWVSR